MADTSTTAKRHQQPHSTDDDIDIGYLFGLLLDNKWLIIGGALWALVLGALYGMFATPIYKGDTLLQIAKKSSGVPGLSELNQIFEQEASAAAEIEILRSRPDQYTFGPQNKWAPYPQAKENVQQSACESHPDCRL